MNLNVSAKINYQKIIIVLCLFPFVQNAFQLFVPSFEKINLLWKILVVTLYVALTLFKSKKIDKLLYTAILCNMYMIIPTFLHDGSYTKFFGYFIDSVGLLFVLNRMSYKPMFLSGVKLFCRIMLYINFILLIIYPQGIYVEDNGYLATRYLFLGMDNQAAILLVTFMIIIYAIEKRQSDRLRSVFWVDFTVFIISTILIWCGTEIVGVLIYIGALIFQKRTKRVITINHCIYILFALFVFVVVINGFDIFSFFVVSFLKKDMTLSGRTLIWIEGIKEWLKYPILGHGYQETEALISFSNIQGYVRGAHNQILNFLLHGGVLSAFCYVFLFRTVHNFIVFFKENKFVNTLTLGILTNFVMWTADTYGHLVGSYLLLGLLYYEGRKLQVGVK